MYKNKRPNGSFGDRKKSFGKKPFGNKFNKFDKNDSRKSGSFGFKKPFGKKRFGGNFKNSSPKKFNSKKGFRGEYIDEKLFINKAVHQDQAKFNSKNSFSDFGLNAQVLENLRSKGYENPSPIQDEAIPKIMQGGDFIGLAQTGTGKTAAFLLPILNKIIASPTEKAMVLAPTRELALQIENELKTFIHGFKIHTISCVGGSPIDKQMRHLARGVSFIIGTPGRIKDLIDRKKINMLQFKTIVLDEADRMLDMGFIDDMRKILGLMPKEKQGLFFSATMSEPIKKLCADFLVNPTTIKIQSRDTATGIEQNIVRAKTKEEKIEALHGILVKPDASKVLIFREMKRHTDDLAKELNKRGFKALALHGDMRNGARRRAVEDLAQGKVHVLIATDVAARGIDIKDITHVINYDIPNNYETYIHRIGRTGRAGGTGIALTFV